MSISAHLKSLLENPQYSRRVLSEKLNVSEIRINELLNGSSPTVEELRKIAAFYEVQPEGLLAKEVIVHYDDHILVVDRVKAGRLVNKSSEDTFEFSPEAYRIPGFNGDNQLIFKVEGESMNPFLTNGDYVIGESLANIEKLKDNSLAIFLLEKQVLVKRLVRHNGDYLLKSDNKKYEPIHLNKGDILAVWIAVGKITEDFVKKSKEYYRQGMELTRKLQIMQLELENCNKDFYEFRDSLKK